MSCGVASADVAARAERWRCSLSILLASATTATSLTSGEKGIVLLIAPDMKQAKVLLDYAEGTLESTPLLRQLMSRARRRRLTLNDRHHP